MSKLEPVNGHAILRPIEEEEQMTGNIVIPDLGQDYPDIGEVLAFSPPLNNYTDELLETPIKVGDKVLIPRMGARSITLKGEEYWITTLLSIIAIIKE